MQYASGDVFDAPCIAVEASVCLNSVTTVFLLANRVHFLVRITPAVRTFSSHFTGLPFRSSQITKPALRKFLEHLLLRSESSTDAKVPRSESSWTFCSSGANIPRNESSTGAKVLSVDLLLPGTKIPFYVSRPTRTGPVFMLDPDNQGPLSLPIN